MSGPNHERVFLLFDRENIEALNVDPPLEALAAMAASPTAIREYAGLVDVVFDGYNNDSRELFSIPEVRVFVQALTRRFPYWLHFSSKSSDGLRVILLCLMSPANVTVVGGQSFTDLDVKELNAVVLNLFGHMNSLYSGNGLSQLENSQTTHEVAAYLKAFAGNSGVVH